MEEIRTRWYKDAVIYQIYPRSFLDSNGDGIGDIKGIISKLDYLQELGINAVWLSPCYKSPNADNGYDISDYRDIMDEFGTLEDWKVMVDGMHTRGIKLIMDLVVNHTSDEHLWFKESRKSINNPYRDYYIWRKGRGKDGKKPPNNWTSRFGGSAWKYDETTDEWFLHLFNDKQPDLNWDNPKVRQEVGDMVKYWLDLGVDGFRCDVITYISKREGLPDGKFNPFVCGDEHFTHGPHIHEYLKELNANVLSKYDCMTVGEAAGVTIREALDYTDEKNNELDTVFHFEHVESDTIAKLLPRKFELTRLKKIFLRWQHGMFGKSWNSLYYENHDQPRSLPRFVGDYGELRKEAAKMLAVSIHMQQGSPYVYQGQEIGMTNCPFENLDEFEDVMVRTVRGMLKNVPFGDKLLLRVMQKRARDHARTPMQWSAADNAGFTTAEKPWLKVNPNYTEINVEEALKDEDSILNFYKKLIAVRKSGLKEIIKNGTYTEYYEKRSDIFVYERSFKGEKLLVICNFKNNPAPFKIPMELAYNSAELVISNYKEASGLGTVTLKPYEAMVYHLK
ncbi:MAG: alpha-glucosidase [Clostridia bacterium]|nr:alpha-glucosidase [Clostridia bacterium]